MADEDTKKEDVKLSDKLEKIAKEIEGLSVLELSELVSSLQDRLGVSAMPAAAPAVAESETGEGEGDQAGSGGSATQSVVLADAGANKISVIKALREINQELGLKEAKDMTDNVPVDVLTDAKKEDAEEAKKKLEDAGAKVELK